jgi:two-component system LytT family sensor kinase
LKRISSTILNRWIVLLLIVGASFNRGLAQHVTIFGKAPIRVDAQGILIKQMNSSAFSDDTRNAAKQKVIPIYIAGNSVAIQTTNMPFGTINISEPSHTEKFNSLSLDHYQLHRLYERSYYTTTPVHGQGFILQIDTLNKVLKQAKNSKHLLKEGIDIGYVSLKVNDFFFIDFYDYNTDTLVRRYYIKRLKVIPEIEIYRQLKGQFYKSPIQISDTQKIVLSPGGKFVTTIKTKPDFGDSAVKYLLINLKTRDTLQQIGPTVLKLPELNSNTDYKFQFNYVIQPESTGVIYLSVKPYWYQSVIFYFIVTIAFALLIIIVLVVVLKKKIKAAKGKQTETEQSLRRIQAQLNPHFTFNALSSIQGLINTNKIDDANYYLHEFSTLLRQTLNRSQYIFNTLDKEIEMMNTYIRLEQLRFNFLSDIEISNTLTLPDIEIPTLILQPLIENAIKHGISVLGEEGQLRITYKEGQQPGDLMIMIEDNGKGFDENTAYGYGLKLTLERIEAVNRLKEEGAITLEFHKHAGTAVTLIFNNWI